MAGSPPNYPDAAYEQQMATIANQQEYTTNGIWSKELELHMAHNLAQGVRGGADSMDNSFPSYGGVIQDDDCFWYSPPDTEIFLQPYTTEDNSLLISQQFYEQDTAVFSTGFTDNLDGPRLNSTPIMDNPGKQLCSLKASKDPGLNSSIICFGMVADIPVHCNQSGSLLVDSALLPLAFKPPNSLEHPGVAQIGEFGTFDERTAKIFANLLAEGGIVIQIYSQNKFTRPTLKLKGNKKSGIKTTQSLINAIIYGPLELCEPVGEYLTKCAIFLQDPLHNDRDVLYKNPHILSRTEKIVLISDLKIATSDVHVKSFDTSRDIFSQLSNDDHLIFTEAPSPVRTELYPHQKKALTFMLQREQADTFKGSDGESWVKEADETSGVIYTNLITGSSQSTIPPESRGGLLADKMGLGKSLTMISLIALNVTQCKEPVIFTSQGAIRRVKSTLIVVPFSLMSTWETQLQRHLHQGCLIWTRFHGPQKRKTLSFGNYDIVITTYETLVSQYKKQQSDTRFGDTLFSFAWHRIVLDEAHTIRNRATYMAQACCAVRATSRWAMTGTPIQNRLTDFASLIEYLHIHPFSNPKTFESEIVKPCFKSDDPDVARMRKLVNFIALCRTKAVINLPKREDETRYLDFSAKEQEYYDRVKFSTIRMMDEALAHSPLAPSQYLNALQWLNELRLICNHGLTHRKMSDKIITTTAATAEVATNQPWNHKTAEKAFETLVKAGHAICRLCGENITEGTGEASNSEFPKPSLSKCLTLICGSCIQNGPDNQRVPTCSCVPKCPKVDVSWAPETPVDMLSENKLPSVTLGDAPTKLKALLECLQQSPRDEKSVIFSYWTYTLDLVGELLKEASIPFARIDGKRSGEQRNKAVNTLEIDDTIRVILVSITCGGTGLDLTAASCAYLLEPQWNPMIEEQALSRIHRLGQTKEVRTVRFRIRNSYEDKIVALQESKRDLAAWAFSDHDRAAAADRTGRLQALRRLLG